jgi:hypothetical protein
MYSLNLSAHSLLTTLFSHTVAVSNHISFLINLFILLSDISNDFTDIILSFTPKWLPCATDVLRPTP